MPKHKRNLPIFTLMLALVLGLFASGLLRAQEKEAESDSSACVNCHTDLEEMDEYGAKAASSAAAVAG